MTLLPQLIHLNPLKSSVVARASNHYCYLPTIFPPNSYQGYDQALSFLTCAAKDRKGAAVTRKSRQKQTSNQTETHLTDHKKKKNVLASQAWSKEMIWRQLLTQTAAFPPRLSVPGVGSTQKFIVATRYGLGNFRTPTREPAIRLGISKPQSTFRRTHLQIRTQQRAAVSDRLQLALEYKAAPASNRGWQLLFYHSNSAPSQS